MQDNFSTQLETARKNLRTLRAQLETARRRLRNAIAAYVADPCETTELTVATKGAVVVAIEARIKSGVDALDSVIG